MRPPPRKLRAVSRALGVSGWMAANWRHRRRYISPSTPQMHRNYPIVRGCRYVMSLRNCKAGGSGFLGISFPLYPVGRYRKRRVDFLLGIVAGLWLINSITHFISLPPLLGSRGLSWWVLPCCCEAGLLEEGASKEQRRSAAEEAATACSDVRSTAEQLAAPTSLTPYYPVVGVS